MKIKLDENLPHQLVQLLTDLGHDVDTVPAEHLAGRDDDVVWAAAQTAGRFPVTQDSRFLGRAEICARHAPGASPDPSGNSMSCSMPFCGRLVVGEARHCLSPSPAFPRNPNVSLAEDEPLRRSMGRVTYILNWCSSGIRGRRRPMPRNMASRSTRPSRSSWTPTPSTARICNIPGPKPARGEWACQSGNAF